jgi:secretion/DNA translocation related CpaE-like protein
MQTHPVIGVLSGCGGAGASVLAAVVAGVAASSGAPALLIDCDHLGGGIDVLLGCEQVPGPRWRQVRLRGGTLDPAVLLDGLPRWQDVSFLAADSAEELDSNAIAQVIDTAAAAGQVVLDLPRWPSPVRAAALARCELVVLVTVAEVRAVTAAALVAAGLDSSRTVLAVRGTSRSLPRPRIGQLLGLEVLGEIGYDPASLRPSGLELQRIRRTTQRLAHEILRRSQDEVLAA